MKRQLYPPRRKIYVASSWRNERQGEIVKLLRRNFYEVYDFKEPIPGGKGFGWSEVDPQYKGWDAAAYRKALDHPASVAGFQSDWNAMQWADTGVLLLPSGRSAHIEAGYFVGAGKQLFILLDRENEPELMYKMATAICLDTIELLADLERHEIGTQDRATDPE
jgi:hypothetical protein